ncbi:hypothetical protein [Candidatus Stoquefichus massiliensis]|nr:hypothetical protein [Candidatus Stoquefichus massiliensis]
MNYLNTGHLYKLLLIEKMSDSIETSIYVLQDQEDFVKQLMQI